jgi:hypothetical protein
MKRMKTLYCKPALVALLLLAAGAFSGCEKYDMDIVGEVDIYLLDEYNRKSDSYAILNTGIVLEATPVLTYDEIRSYNSKSRTFDIDPAAAERMKDLFGSAFAVAIDGEVIYTGYFWLPFSSQIVDWIVTDLLTLETSARLEMDLGYPSLMEGMKIPDKRNDRRVLSVFQRDGKLID